MNLLEKLRKKFSKKDYIDCGVCSDCCGPLLMTNQEKKEIHELLVKKWIKWPVGGWWVTCEFLVDGKCSIYEKRPMICRLFGYLKTEHTTCPKFPQAADEEEWEDIKEYKKEVEKDKTMNRCLHCLLSKDERSL